MFPPRQLTPQGFESQFATNHLGHFALSGLLYDTIRRGRDARVVTVTSNLHRGGAIHFHDLSGGKAYSPPAFYQQSKIAHPLFRLRPPPPARRARAPAASVRA